MANIEVEIPEGQKDLTKRQKLEARKAELRYALGDELYEKLMGEAKSFFEANKKEIRYWRHKQEKRFLND